MTNETLHPKLKFAVKSAGPLDAEFFREFKKVNNRIVTQLEAMRRELEEEMYNNNKTGE